MSIKPVARRRAPFTRQLLRSTAGGAVLRNLAPKPDQPVRIMPG
ncbi:MAG: hypothetical protein ACYCXU_03465 [Thermoleophilia bacterium]